MAESIPELKSSIKQLREKLDTMLFQDQSPESIRRTVSESRSAQAHRDRHKHTTSRKHQARDPQKRHKKTGVGGSDRCGFLQKLCDLEGSVVGQSGARTDEVGISGECRDAKDLCIERKRDGIQEQERDRDNRVQNTEFKRKDSEYQVVKPKIGFPDTHDLTDDTCDTGIGPNQVDAFEKALEAHGLHPKSYDANASFLINTSSHTHANSSGYHSKATESYTTGEDRPERPKHSCRGFIDPSQKKVSSPVTSDLLLKSQPDHTNLDKLSSAQISLQRTDCLDLSSTLPFELSQPVCERFTDNFGCQSDSAVLVTGLQEPVCDPNVSIERHMEKRAPSASPHSESIVFVNTSLSSVNGCKQNPVSEIYSTCPTEGDVSDSESDLSVSIVKHVEQGTPTKAKVVCHYQPNISAVPPASFPKDMFACVDQSSATGSNVDNLSSPPNTSIPLCFGKKYPLYSPLKDMSDSFYAKQYDSSLSPGDERGSQAKSQGPAASSNEGAGSLVSNASLQQSFKRQHVAMGAMRSNRIDNDNDLRSMVRLNVGERKGCSAGISGYESEATKFGSGLYRYVDTDVSVNESANLRGSPRTRGQLQDEITGGSPRDLTSKKVRFHVPSHE